MAHRNTSPTVRCGYSLIEILVAVIVFALGLSLLVPAAARAWDVAGQTQTANNLKQCTLAVHSHHDYYRKMPPAFAEAGKYPRTDKTVWFHLLPFVEALNVYQDDNADESIVSPFVAPSDPTKTAKGNLSFAANIRVFGHQKYTKEICNDPTKSLKPAEPKSATQSGLTMRWISSRDGASNTICFATRMSSCDRDADGKPVFTRINGDAGTPNGGYFGGPAVSAPPGRLYAAEPTIAYQVSPKEFDKEPLGKSVKCIKNPIGVPHSFAPTLLVSLIDGSTRSISRTITPKTFGRAICPGDGQPLGEDWEE